MVNISKQISQCVHNNRATSGPYATRVVQLPNLPNRIAFERPRPHPRLALHHLAPDPNIKPNLSLRRADPQLHPVHPHLRSEHDLHLYLLLRVCLLFSAGVESPRQEDTQHRAGGIAGSCAYCQRHRDARPGG